MLSALDVLRKLAEGLEEDFAPFLSALWAPLVVRFGDAKGASRERAVDLAVSAAT